MTDGAAGLFAGRAGPEGARGLFLIAGPCVLEDDDVQFRIADLLVELSERYGVPILFKASFDKANRSSRESHRGPGLSAGLAALDRVRARTALRLITDIHVPDQAVEAAAVVDALQIPAFLCRQTDLLHAAAATGRPVNVKKGQWMAPEDIAGVTEKLRGAGATEIAVTERGTVFGYGRWIVDMRSFDVMKRVSGCPAIFDASHAVQLPGGGGNASGGEPRHIEALAGAAVAAGADGLFIEVHPDPGNAQSDGANVLPLDRLDGLLSRCVRIRDALS
jgi:2-dehydro-3-deoxyphosphooctonate aldolase (KDO 8-P synthase)